jgi:hypothetical protein
MQKYHVHTTVSSKHKEILKRQVEKHGSYQKVLELALESLEHSAIQPPLTPDEEFWMRVGREAKGICLIQGEAYKFLLTTLDLERFKDFADQHKMIEATIELYYQKTLLECSLKEVLDGVIATGKFSGLADSITYSDHGDHYRMKFIHDMGLVNSKWLKMMLESLFKSYGVRADITISSRSLFINVHKNV